MSIFKSIFKSKIDKLKSKITKENLLLLDIDDLNSEYELQKLYDWQEEYDWVGLIEDNKNYLIDDVKQVEIVMKPNLNFDDDEDYKPSSFDEYPF